MTRILIGIGALILLLAGAWFALRPGTLELGGISPRLIGTSAAVESDYVVPPVVGDYTNDEFRFSLKMPDGFRSSELPPDDSGAKTILLQDAQGNGIQIYITPDIGDMRTLTASDIRASIPDMQVENEQIVEIGDDYKGIAFMSDNEAFSGASREVWFYFRGNLYQISTYARLDNLLQAMFVTWRFF
jgi:hypothetical protein